MPFTDGQLAQYEEQGAVTIDTPFTPKELDRAEAAWDRLKQTGGKPYEDPDFIEVVQHPFFEAVAKKVLRAQAVHLWWGLAPHERAPASPPYADSQDQWARGCHTDIQATIEDFEATPRREHLAIWFWLNDVPAERAAMRVLKGSHKRLGAHWQEMQQHWKANPNSPLPVRHGPRWEAEGEPDARWFAALEPTAMAAPRGYAQVFSQSLLHAGWHSEDTEPRKGFHISWVADGVSIGGMRFNDQSGRIDGVRQRSAELRQVMAPERRHVAMDNSTLERLVELWDEEWPPTLRGRFRL